MCDIRDMSCLYNIIMTHIADARLTSELPGADVGSDFYHLRFANIISEFSLTFETRIVTAS